VCEEIVILNLFQDLYDNPILKNINVQGKYLPQVNLSRIAMLAEISLRDYASWRNEHVSEQLTFQDDYIFVALFPLSV
jgi:hypothetical protein